MPLTLSSFQTVYDRLYPARCGFCGLGSGFICAACRDDLQRNAPACERCAVPLELAGICADCLRAPPPWSRASVPWRYAFPLNLAVKQFKFHAAQYHIPMFAELLRPACETLHGTVDLIQPMPLHWRRHAWRGFNQATEIARPIGHMLEAPIGDIVRRRRHTPPQSSLPSKARRRDLDPCFRARRALQGERVLIVDDVMTTGASVAALSRSLRQAGASEVSVLALARS